MEEVTDLGALPEWTWITDLGPGLLPSIDEQQLEALADQLARLPNDTLARLLPAYIVPDGSRLAAYKIIAQRWNRGGLTRPRQPSAPVLASSLGHLAYNCGYGASEGTSDISAPDKALLSALARSLRYLETRLCQLHVPPGLHADLGAGGTANGREHPSGVDQAA